MKQHLDDCIFNHANSHLPNDFNNLETLEQFIPHIEEIDISKTLVTLGRNDLLVYSLTAMQLANIDPVDLNCQTVNAKDFGIIDNLLRQKTNKLKGNNIEKVTVFGAGGITDAAKRIAMLLNVPIDIIPSVISTNTAATKFACLDVDDLYTKTTVDTGLANRILCDYNFLGKNGALNMRGMSDVLSIATALKDWIIAYETGEYKQEPSSQKTYILANQILDKSIQEFSQTNITDFSDKEVIKNILYFVFLSSAITTMHGSGRPESGSEHIFSKALELYSQKKHGENIAHGLSVGIGNLVMEILQENQYYKSIINIYRKTKILEPITTNQQLLKDVIQILTNIRPHKTRNSIVNVRIKDLHNTGFVRGLVGSVLSDLK